MLLIRIFLDILLLWANFNHPMKGRERYVVVIDLFAGAGGLTEGFLQEGFSFVAHIEKERWACETLKTRLCYHFLKNNNRLDLYKRYINESKSYLDIEKNREVIFNEFPELRERLEQEVINKTFGDPLVDSSATPLKDIIQLIDDSKQKQGIEKINVIIGGPPCQAYSLVGRAKMGETVDSDSRNYLFRYYKEIVRHYEPDMFVFENVPGLITAQKGEVLRSIKKEFEDIGYSLLTGVSSDDNKNILDAWKFGVNQTRKRLIIIGFKSNTDCSYPDFLKHVEISNEQQNTWNTIGDLPFLKAGEGVDHGLVEYNTNNSIKLSKFQKLMRKENIGILNHRARPVNKEYDREIYAMVIKAAETKKRIQYKDLPECLRKHRNVKSFQDRFWTHWWYDMPHTIVAHISRDGHYNIHPDINQLRSLTVREAARIQSFPDDYYFEGPRTWQYVQVGNAVPPMMSRVIAKAVKAYYK